MKTSQSRILTGFMLVHLLLWPCAAATVVWTNTSGGLWSNPINWSPNQAPGAADDAVVTNSGTYRITLDTNATVASFILGGDGGQQTLTNSSKTLTLTGASAVDTNGILGLGGGVLSGNGLLTVKGVFLWTGGTISGGSLTVASNATLTVSGSADKTMVTSALTNAGTVVWTGTGALVGRFPANNQTNRIVNQGVFEAQSDAALRKSLAGAYNNALFLFENAGTWRKSGTTGTNLIEASFTSTGAVDLRSGVLRLAGNYAPSPTASLSVLIGGLVPGAESSQLQVAGVASLNGGLVINAASGFVPGAYDTFLILTSRARQGTFGGVTSDPIGSRTWYNPRYLTNGVELAVMDAAGQISGIGCNPTNHMATLSLAGIAGQNYRIEASTDFKQWMTLGTNRVPGSALLDFVDVESTNFTHRFYRAWLVQ